MPASHVHYDEQFYGSAEECLRNIKSRLDWGWKIVLLESCPGGYRVVFNVLEEEPSPERTSTAGGLA